MQTTRTTVYRVDYSDQVGYYIQAQEALGTSPKGSGIWYTGEGPADLVRYEDGWRDSELGAIEVWRLQGNKEARDLRALADAIETMSEYATPKVWENPIMAPILGEV